MKKKGIEQYRQVQDLRGHPNVLTIPAREPDAPPPLLTPSDEQVLIARVELDQRKRRPAPAPVGEDPRTTLSKVRLPDEPITAQAVRAAGTNLTRAQRRRERHQQRQQQQANRRAQRKPFTVGDLLGNIGVGAFVLLAIVVVAAWLGGAA